MKPDNNRTEEASELRRLAEAKLRVDQMVMPYSRTEAESQRLLQELRIHQIELEMQNAELRRARDESERALEMYSDLYDFAPVGYMSLDRERLICTANVTLSTLLGMERSRLIGRRFDSFVSADAAHDFIAFIDTVFESEAKETSELALRSKENLRKFVRVEAVANVSGGECRAAVIDISKRRKLEEELKDVHADLLAHASELEAANVDLEAFNYSVSHDLRGPLTVIAGYCEIVEELFGSKLYEQCQDYIGKIQEGAMCMNQLIDTLLDFSRVKCVELNLERVDLGNVAEEVALKLKAAEPERQVTFRIAKGIMADCDVNLLRVVLDNLMGNAWKYSVKREEAAIEFDVTNVDGETIYYIRDNGSGFDMEHAEDLFRPFQRLAGTDIAGHGIGLATVDRIIRRHGGKVWVESQPDEGTTFFFTLE